MASSVQSQLGSRNGGKVHNYVIPILCIIPIIVLSVCLPGVFNEGNNASNDTYYYYDTSSSWQDDWGEEKGEVSESGSGFSSSIYEGVEFGFTPQTPQSCYESEVTSLGDFVYVSVCGKNEQIIVDIRLFHHVNGGISPTIKGINLSLKQWHRLVKRMRIIESDVRTVQKRLHTPTNDASLL